jgi:hypothetical protein
MQMADKVIMRPVAALIPYARNARTHSEDQVAHEPVGASHRGALTVSNRGVQGHTRRLFLPGSYYAKAAAISYRHFGC